MIISDLAVAIRVSVSNVRVYLFLKGIFIMKQKIEFTWCLENNIKFA